MRCEVALIRKTFKAMLTRRHFVFALLGFIPCAANAFEIPLVSSAVASANDAGTAMSTRELIDLPGYFYRGADRSHLLYVRLETPWSLLAFVASEVRTTYGPPKNKLMKEIAARTVFNVIATAFSTVLRFNDNMVVILKQNGKVVHPLKKEYDNDTDVLTVNDQAGYSTSLRATFDAKQLDVKSPFTIVITNIELDRTEYTFEVDSANIK